MKRLFIKHIRTILTGVLVAGYALGHAQTPAMTLTVLSPVCPSGSGSVQVSFINVSYPFDLFWSGSNIQSGSVVITGSPQTVAIAGSTTGYWNSGTRAHFYDNVGNGNYFGLFPVGIYFDPFAKLPAVTCSGGVTFNVKNIAGGTPPYTLLLTEKSSGSVITSGTSPLNATYAQVCPNTNNISIRVTDSNGCYTNMDSFTLYCQGLNVQTSVTAASCTNGSAQVVSVSGGVSPYTYSWSNGATSTSITGLVRGSYTCTVTDANSCSGDGQAYVTQSPEIGVNVTTAPATCNNPDGQSTAFAAGGTAPYTYLWDNGNPAQAATNLLAGTHTVIVTDANSCTGEGYAYVSSNSPVTVTYSTTPSSCTSATGTVTLSVSGGQTPYSYKWHGLSGTTNSVSGLASGTYSFTVTDVNGCERKGTVYVPPISQITASTLASDAVCPANTGAATVYAYSSAGSLSYLWNNSATTSSIKGVPVGGYTCVITDANSCKLTKYVYVGQKSPIGLGFKSTQASCIFNADATITVTPYGGTSPYTYAWSNGATTASVSGLKYGKYNVRVTDANGCSQFDWVTVGYDQSNNSCYCTVSGIVYDDINGNCTQDAGEDGISDVLINTSGGGYTTTDDQGNYSIMLPTGSYTLEEILQTNISLSSCQSNNIAVSVTASAGCTKTYDFANQLVPSHDIHIFSVNDNAPVPGHDYVQRLVIKNRGNVKETDIQASYLHDGQLQWQNGYGAPFSNTGGDHYALSPALTLSKGKAARYYLDYYTPTNVPIGTLVYFRDTAAYKSPLATYWLTNEETPWNNISDLYTTVVSSFDPNYKEVYPRGEGQDGNILLKDKDFRYVIHFENNGTAPAQKVVVIDTLDPDLDIKSFRTLYASHNMKTHIDDNRVVTFTFDNINLDFTPKGEFKPTAQGMVAYTIKAKNTVALGTKLTNKADIYFDYNAPVPTNTTVNTYVAHLSSVNPVGKAANGITAYPNPAGNILNLLVPQTFKGVQAIEVFNVMGQLVMTAHTEDHLTTLDIASLNSGIYFVRITSANGGGDSIRFIKE